jgi:hypothetical protein
MLLCRASIVNYRKQENLLKNATYGRVLSMSNQIGSLAARITTLRAGLHQSLEELDGIASLLGITPAETTFAASPVTHRLPSTPPPSDEPLDRPRVSPETRQKLAAVARERWARLAPGSRNLAGKKKPASKRAAKV